MLDAIYWEVNLYVDSVGGVIEKLIFKFSFPGWLEGLHPSIKIQNANELSDSDLFA